MPPGVPPARFVLIAPKQAADKWPPFYLMRFKTSNAQYRAFDGTWPENNDWPAVGMPVMRAHQFAGFLGGRLPDPEETDRAAGFDPNDPGGPPQAARAVVGRREQGPLPVARDNPGDATPDGVADLFGNG